MEGPVPHDMPLLPRHQPRPHGCRLPLCQEAVHVATPEHGDRGVSQHLEPPEPPDGELGVEVPHCRQRPGVAEVDEVILAVEAAEGVPRLSLIHRNVVVDSYLMILFNVNESHCHK